MILVTLVNQKGCFWLQIIETKLKDYQRIPFWETLYHQSFWYNRGSSHMEKLKHWWLSAEVIQESLDFQWKAGLGIPWLIYSVVKNPPAKQETLIWSLGQEDPLEEGMATHSSILAWRISMDRRAWWRTVHGVAKSWTLLKWFSMHVCA